MAAPLLTLQAACVRHVDKPVFSGVTLAVNAGDRICLLGRNGAGKTTLLKAFAGLIPLDEGKRVVKSGVRVAYLQQEPVPASGQTIADYVASLLESRDPHDFRIMRALDTLGLDGGRTVEGLSGGELRKASLAAMMAGEADVLLLDEPTNHLDIDAILGLESWLAEFRGAAVIVSHDRAFLSRVTNRLNWLHRGSVLTHGEGFDAFEEWSEKVLEEEASDLAKLEKRIAEETRWSHEGITARRKRNQGRLRRLQALRAERAARAGDGGIAAFDIREGAGRSRRVVEAMGIGKSYPGEDGGPRWIFRDFSTRILRGDRVGFVGANGTGKTTMLGVLSGRIEADEGEMRRADNLAVTYFDQRREELDPEMTLWQYVAGNEAGQVIVQGRASHVVSYLGRFRFDEHQVRGRIGILSGGEKNRLMLARLLADPADLLVLDEPTNDLDLETLDLLLDALDEYQGTLLISSHDRDFLDRLVSGIIAFDGAGGVEEFVGGYWDYERQRKRTDHAPHAGGRPAGRRAGAEKSAGRKGDAKPAGRLSYKDKRALELLPRRMEALRAEIEEMTRRLSDPGLWERDADAFTALARRLDEARAELDEAETRWLELEMRREELEG